MDCCRPHESLRKKNYAFLNTAFLPFNQKQIACSGHSYYWTILRELFSWMPINESLLKKPFIFSGKTSYLAHNWKPYFFGQNFLHYRKHSPSDWDYHSDWRMLGVIDCAHILQWSLWKSISFCVSLMWVFSLQGSHGRRKSIGCF